MSCWKNPFLWLGIAFLVVAVFCSSRRHKDKFTAALLNVTMPVGNASTSSQFSDEPQPSEPCEWLGIAGYSTEIVNACESYRSKNGNGSAASLVLQISENFEPFDDANILNFISSAGILAPMQCSSSDPCPPVGVVCKTGACV
jgi:hypothetical protein